MQPLGLNERMVRTSVYRLSQEKWLVSEQLGRKSFYSLTTSGRRRFEHAYRRIYFAPQDTWTGEWQMVLIPASLAGAQRDSLRKELAWAGYGALASGFLLCFAATATATLYHYVLGQKAPYPFWSLPVLLGTRLGSGQLPGQGGGVWRVLPRPRPALRTR